MLRQVGKVNYEIEMPDKGGRKQVSMLTTPSKWKEHSCRVNAVIEDGDELEEHQWTNTSGDILESKYLNPEGEKFIQFCPSFHK